MKKKAARHSKKVASKKKYMKNDLLEYITILFGGERRPRRCSDEERKIERIEIGGRLMENHRKFSSFEKMTTGEPLLAEPLLAKSTRYNKPEYPPSKIRYKKGRPKWQVPKKIYRRRS
jgi:hypothetical protein